MIKLIIGFFISLLFLFPINSAFAKEIPQKNIVNLTNKVAKKFSRTFCNTSNFGISDEGAIEFAVGETNKVAKKFSRTFCNTSNFGISDEGAIEFAMGETNKEFSKNKLIEFVDFDEINKKIISNIEGDCQVFDFPVEVLAKLEDIKN